MQVQDKLPEGYELVTVDLQKDSDMINRRLRKFIQKSEKIHDSLSPRVIDKERIMKLYRSRQKKRKRDELLQAKELEKFREFKKKPKSILKKPKIKKIVLHQHNSKRARFNWQRLNFKRICFWAILNHYKYLRSDLLEKRPQLKSLINSKFIFGLRNISTIFKKLGKESLKSLWLNGQEIDMIFDKDIRKEYNYTKAKAYERDFAFFKQKDADLIHVSLC